MACSGVVAGDGCALAAPGEAPVATVTWSSADAVQVHVELDGRGADRALRFQPEDAAPSRWRTVGLVVGALVIELGGGEGEDAAGAPRPEGTRATEPPPADELPEQAEGEEPRRVPAARVTGPTFRERRLEAEQAATKSKPDRLHATREGAAWAVGAGVVGGLGLTTGPPRGGGYVRASYLPAYHLGAAATLAASARPEADRVAYRWWSAAGSALAAPELGPRWDLLLGLGLAVERWAVVRTAFDLTPAFHATRDYLSFRLDLEAGYRLGDRLRVTFGGGFTSSPGQQVIDGGEPIGRNPRVAPFGAAGVQFGRF